MPALKLRYTGPLPECGFTGPATGNMYVAHTGESFVVMPDDAPGLMKRYGHVLAEVKATPRKAKAEPETVEAVEEVSAEEGDNGTDGGIDTPITE